MATISGNSGSNTLIGTNADDTLIGGGGNDTLQGRQGTDTAKFSGPVSRYTLGTQGKYIYIQDSGADGSDRLSNIELMAFSNATLSVSQHDFSIPHSSLALQTESSITTLSHGGYVVTWTASTHFNDHGDLGIFAQRFNADGKALGSVITISESAGGVLCESSVSALANGGFVVSWKDKIDQTVYAQTFNATGIAQSAAIVVSADSVNSYGGLVDRYTPQVVTFENGDFLIVDVASSDRNIYAQRYDSQGNTVGSSFRINTDTAGSQHSISITVLQNGNTASAWVVFPDDLDDDEFLRIQIHNGETPVGNTIDIAAADSNITALGDGGFVVTWRSSIYDAASGTNKPAFSFQRYDADAIAVGSVVQQRANIPVSSDLTCTSLSNGGFVVVCGTVWARMYDADGNIIAEELDFAVKSGGGDPAVTARADGGFTVCWTSNYNNGPLYYQSFDGDGNYLGKEIRGTSGADTLRAGNSAMLTLHGGAGNDTLYGSSGNTTLIGGNGADTLVSGSGNEHFIGTGHNDLDVDTVSYAKASSSIVVDMALTYAQSVGGGMGMDTIDSTVDSISGSRFNDILHGNGYNNTLNGEAGDDRLFGDEGEDRLLGMAGSDILNGGNGFDVLAGGSGNDTLNGGASMDYLYGDGGKDRLVGGAGGDDFYLTPGTAADVDLIVDFSRQEGDKIGLYHIPRNPFQDSIVSENFRSGANVRALDSDDYILYNTRTGELFYDPDGNGKQAPIKLAIIGSSTHPALKSDDLFVLYGQVEF